MRVISQAGLDALDSGNFAVRNLVLFEIASGNYGFWDDVYNLSYGGETYLGQAGRFTISALPSVADQSVQGVDIAFSALDSVAMAMAQNEVWHQKPMHISRGIFNASNGQAITIETWFRGFIDQALWQERVNGEARLTLKCESVSRELSRKSASTRSDADQRRRDSSDGFFKHTAAAVTQQIYWGRNGPTKAG